MARQVTLLTFYRIALLGPLVGMGVALLLDRLRGAGEVTSGHLILPDSLTRGIIAYCGVAVWLWIELGRRPEPAFRALIWRAPLLYLAASGLLVIVFAALRGWLGALWPERAGVILLRSVAHLVIAYGYVALLHLALGRLQASGVLRPPAAEPS